MRRLTAKFSGCKDYHLQACEYCSAAHCDYCSKIEEAINKLGKYEDNEKNEEMLQKTLDGITERYSDESPME